MIPAIFCTHANENPAVCRCPDDCYCKTHTCKHTYTIDCRVEEYVGVQIGEWEVPKPQYEPETLRQKLGYLTEECGEVLAAVGKTLRWGLQGFNPELPEEKRETNREWILRELLDLQGAITRIQKELTRNPKAELQDE